MRITGIYEIQNIVTGMSYIGQSVDIYKRWDQHIKDLIRNKHDNYLLQYAWNKYGRAAFQFFIINECPKKLLDTQEQYYIQDYINNNIKLYNISLKNNLSIEEI